LSNKVPKDYASRLFQGKKDIRIVKFHSCLWICSPFQWKTTFSACFHSNRFPVHSRNRLSVCASQRYWPWHCWCSALL